MIKEVNSHEAHTIEFLAALDAQVQRGETSLKARLQTIPNAWRDYRMCSTRLGRILVELYKTVPDKTLRHMQAICERGEVIVRFRPPVKIPGDDFQLVPTRELKELINTAMEERCTMCFEDRAGVKACALRKALIQIAPPQDLDRGECPYRYVVEACDRGDYI